MGARFLCNAIFIWNLSKSMDIIKFSSKAMDAIRFFYIDGCICTHWPALMRALKSIVKWQQMTFIKSQSIWRCLEISTLISTGEKVSESFFLCNTYSNFLHFGIVGVAQKNPIEIAVRDLSEKLRPAEYYIYKQNSDNSKLFRNIKTFSAFQFECQPNLKIFGDSCKAQSNRKFCS